MSPPLRAPSRGPFLGPRPLCWRNPLDRYAVFVDAGYVIAAGGQLCCRTSNREMISIDVAGLRDYLNCIANESTSISVLRMYWYDAAPYGRPTQDHDQIASLANIKLRLGRIKGGKQKGVDALIYHDLITLTRERAISDALLVSGDDDMLEAVRAVQEMGIRVTLVGIPSSNQRTNQSRELCQEADEAIILDTQRLSELFATRISTPISEEQELEKANQVGYALAKKVFTNKTKEQLTNILKEHPIVPKKIDSILLRSLGRALNLEGKVKSQLREAARSSFWTNLNTLYTSTP